MTLKIGEGQKTVTPTKSLSNTRALFLNWRLASRRGFACFSKLLRNFATRTDSFREGQLVFHEKYHSSFVAFCLQRQGQDRSTQLMIWVIFGTVLARNWTKQGAGSKLYRTNDPSGSANLVRAGPPDPASAAPTANPYLVKRLSTVEIYHPLPLRLLSKIL